MPNVTISGRFLDKLPGAISNSDFRLYVLTGGESLQ